MAERWRRVWAPMSTSAVLPLTPFERRRYFRVAAIARSIAIGVLGSVLLWSLRDSSTWVLVAVAVWMYPGIVRTWFVLRRSGVLAPHLWLRDLVSLSVFASLVPHYLVVAMMASLAIVAFSCVTMQRTSTVVLSVASVVGMSVAAAIDVSDMSMLSAFAFPLALAAIVVPMSMAADTMQRSLAFNTNIADALSVALFESTGVAGQPASMYHLYAPRSRRFTPTLSEQDWLDLLHPDDRHISDEIDDAVSAGHDYHVRYRQRDDDGEYRWVDEVGRVAKTGDVVKVLGMTRDVTEWVNAEKHLSRLDQMTDKIEVGIAILRLADPDDLTSLTVVWENEMARRLDSGGHVGERVIDVDPASFGGPDGSGGGLGRKVAEIAAGGATWRVADGRVLIDGEERLVSMIVSPLPDHHCAVVLHDTTDLWAARAELERLAYVDPLTGLPNRTRLRQRLAHAPIGSMLLVMDLDRFTDVNEAFGHGCGDEMIVEVARVLADAPDGVTVARLGGDEFAILAPPGTGQRDDLVGRIFHALTRPVQLPNGLTLQASASMGITTKTKADTPADELLRQADVALHRAKQMRNAHEVYDPRIDTSAPHRMMLLGELRRALVSGELELHHQPAVSTATGEIRSVESLLVWRHPSLGILSASELTEMVDLSNLNADVVLYSLHEGIEHYRRWQQAGVTVPLSINVNGATVHDASLVERMARVLQEADLPPHAIGLELAEAQLKLGKGIGIESLHRLSAAGFWLTIDHFGTGRTTYSVLRASGANAIKLDRRAVAELMPADRELLDALRAVVRRSSLMVAAEGADDEATFRWLVDHGIDLVQGAFVGPARDADAMGELLASNPLVPLVPIAR